jgi:hypothetical protein
VAQKVTPFFLHKPLIINHLAQIKNQKNGIKIPQPKPRRINGRKQQR